MLSTSMSKAKSTRIINTGRDTNAQYRFWLINRCNQEAKKTQTSEQTQQTEEDYLNPIRAEGTRIIFSKNFFQKYCIQNGFASTEDFINNRNNLNDQVDHLGSTLSDNEYNQ